MKRRDKLMKGLKYLQIVVVVLMATILLMVAPTSGIASSASFTIIPQSQAQAQTGKTYGQWSAVWWQYALSIPTPDNPLLDGTGAKCRVGQAGSSPVFFLVGTFGGTATRDECKVPGGKVLFFPILNTANIKTLPGDDEKNLRARNTSFLQSTKELHASIDGVDIGAMVSLDPDTSPLRAASPEGFFTVTVPENGVFGIPPGSYDAVADGFYLMVAPLPPGRHTIEFGGATRNFTTDVTYNLK
jgi:hypothetical protein